MATAEQIMKVIQDAVATAVSETMKQMTMSGAGFQEKSSQHRTVDTIMKRMDKFHKDNFQDWKFRLEMCIKGSNQKFHTLMSWAEDQELYIDMETSVKDEDREMNCNLYYILAQLTEGEAFDVVKNVGNQNGGEAWRKLCRRFSGKTRGKRLHMIRKSVNPPKIKKLSEVMGMIEKWEICVRRLLVDFKEELSHGLKIGILLEMMPGDVAEHLSQKVADDDKYENVKEMVLRYVEMKADFVGDPMDVGAMEHKEDPEDDYEEGLFAMGKGYNKGGRVHATRAASTVTSRESAPRGRGARARARTASWAKVAFKVSAGFVENMDIPRGTVRRRAPARTATCRASARTVGTRATPRAASRVRAAAKGKDGVCTVCGRRTRGTRHVQDQLCSCSG